MHGWMTSRHEGCVSTMLTESGLSIALPVRHFKALCGEIEGASRQAPCCRGLFVLTFAHRPDGGAGPWNAYPGDGGLY
jgi:hypothetical protein